MSDPREKTDWLRTQNAQLKARLEETESRLNALRGLEEGLRKSEQRFRAIFDHSNDAIFLVDVEHDSILDVNRRACEMLGYTRAELLSLPMSVIHPHEMPKVRAFARSVAEEGQGFTDELTCVAKSGETLAAEISGAILEVDHRTCMIASVRDVSERERLVEVNEYLDGEVRATARFGAIIANSPEMTRVLEQVAQVAPANASVLITGESGTGKELVARAIHERSDRSARALVRVNCASIPAELFESEFFGHVKGAFTTAVRDRPGRFELADKGTIFLDEVGEIPQQLQSKLLRVVQEGEFERVGESRTRRVDVRILAATNKDLAAEVRHGRFREDLFYRLSVFPIEVPPLRQRPGDIPPLAEHYVEEACRRLGKPHTPLTADQIAHLACQPWLGNVRELQNAIERAVILSRGDRLVFDLAAGPGAPTGGEIPVLDQLLDARVGFEEFQRELLVRALERSGGNQSQAARLLGMTRRTLQYRISKFKIDPRAS
ncbi:MAG: sigma-54 interaction domain-containing protein [Planctomycetota bacterium]|jgi:PAS domain S-box-containing protein